MNRNIRDRARAVAVCAALLIAISLITSSALMREQAGAQPGDLDPTFGTGGKVITPVSVVNGVDGGNAMAIQSDGKIVVAGVARSRTTDYDYALARYNVDGSLDVSFGSGGKVISPIADGSGISESIFDIAIQPDGKIIAVGSSSTQTDFVTVRYNSDGSFDNTFGVGGKVFTTPTNGNYCTSYAVALQSDGKIVTAGSGWVNTGTNSTTDFTLVRYNSNGTVDTTFGVDGIVVTHIGSDVQSSAYINSLAIQQDGKIVAAGYTSGPDDFALARYNTDGTLDSNFGSGGKIITPAGVRAYSVAIQSDGKILAAGTPSFSLARYNINGTPDVTFGGSGFVTTQIGEPDSVSYDLTLQSDGKIVATGTTSQFSLESQFAVVRSNSDGSLDMSFGSNGTVITAVNSDAGAEAVIVQNDGRIVVAGNSVDGQDPDFALARYDASGALDPGFGSGGKVVTQVAVNEDADDFAQAVAVQGDGKIVVAGYTYPYPAFALARYNSDGTLDAGFGSSGKVVSRFGTDYGSAYAVTIQSDGKIVVAGSKFRQSGYSNFALVRYNSNGSLDSSFGIDGRVVTDFGDLSVAYAVSIQSDGKIVAAGKSNNRFALARYNFDGSLDAGFGVGGKVVTFLNGLSHAHGVAIQNDGRIVAAGYRQIDSSTNHAFTLTRYNSDGSRDMGFGIQGRATTPAGYLYMAYAVALQNDGRIVVGGKRGTAGFGLARFDSNGMLDPTFGVDGEVLTSISGGSVNSIAIQNDGKIVAAGSSGIFGNANFAMARYSAGGILDQGFGNNGIVSSPFTERDDIATAVALQSDGKVIAVGRSDSNLHFDFALARYEGGASAGPGSRRAFDFDGDGKADLSVFRPSTAVWYIRNSSTDTMGAQIFGLSTDRLVPSDYDGDGKTDVAVFRDGMWYRLNSTDSTFVAIHFGQVGDIPAPGDYDGDFKADETVFRNGTWYSMQSSAGFKAVQFGLSNDKPVAADYDGDGKFDQAVYRDGVWYMLQSESGFAYEQFGVTTDSPVQSDYDGDGKADMAVYRNGTWYVRRSTTGIPYFVTLYLGTGNPATGTPVPADYDGDSKTDMGVFRDGAWHIRRSTDGGLLLESFGAAGDVPVPSVYVP